MKKMIVLDNNDQVKEEMFPSTPEFNRGYIANIDDVNPNATITNILAKRLEAASSLMSEINLKNPMVAVSNVGTDVLLVQVMFLKEDNKFPEGMFYDEEIKLIVELLDKSATRLLGQEVHFTINSDTNHQLQIVTAVNKYHPIVIPCSPYTVSEEHASKLVSLPIVASPTHYAPYNENVDALIVGGLLPSATKYSAKDISHFDINYVCEEIKLQSCTAYYSGSKILAIYNKDSGLISVL